MISGPRSSAALQVAVMAVLATGPAHPYGVANALRQKGLDAVLRVNSGALYHCFHALDRLGWVEPAGVSRVGRRPQRQTYQLTALGREALGDQLRTLLSVVDGPARFQAGLAFLGLLSQQESSEVLRERVWALQRSLRTSREGYRQLLGQGVARGSLLELEYRLLVGENELMWLRQLVQQIDAGELAPVAR